ncbi:DinB family protein [Aurantibacter sp.]|uniref:DinB family protein n=1 Tax=Aurantibacter sp. TaxID=2807103 RepID=UPI0035C7DD67
MTVKSLKATEYLDYFSHFLNLVPQNESIVESLELVFKNNLEFFLSIPVAKHEYRYKNGKWTIKELLSHLIDTERIFNYRALRIARNDKTPMEGFNENDYAVHSFANSRSMESLIEEYKAVKLATIALFNNFSPEVLRQVGVASGHNVSVRAIGFIISGHEIHHVNVIKERYLE